MFKDNLNNMNLKTRVLNQSCLVFLAFPTSDADHFISLVVFWGQLPSFSLKSIRNTWRRIFGYTGTAAVLVLPLCGATPPPSVGGTVTIWGGI